LLQLPAQFNAATYFIDRHAAEGRDEKLAIECGDEKVTYRSLFEQTNRMGNALLKLGVRPEDRVIVLLLDEPEFLYCFFGAIKIGAVAVPVNTLLKAPEYEYILNDTRAHIAIVSGELLPEFQHISAANRRHLQNVIVFGEAGPRCRNLQKLMQDASPHLEAEPTSRDDPAFWLYSSGSTGSPKGCVHLQHDMVVCSELYAKGILGMNEHDRCYSVAKLFFAYGLGNAGYFPLAVGATSILSPGRPTPDVVYANIERYRPTLFFSVPSNYAALLAHHREDGREFNLSSIRHGISAGEPLPAVLFERFKQRFGVEILDSLGSTETLQMVIANRPGEVRPGSSGKIIPGFEARIVDDQGEDVPVGQIGTLMVKSDATCAGYWNQHEKSKDTFVGHWFRTGDKYCQDEDGYFWYAGRADDLFKVNGRWLSPTEVESALMAHPAVLEAAVVCREDENRLLKPAAFVVVNHGFQPTDNLTRELQDWVAEKIGAYKRPRWVKFLNEIPKTATGKVQRFKLRESYKEGHSS
jgi:benzoate-CoA ligase